MTLLKKILPFGEIMVSLGTITKEQLDIALKEGKKTGTRVGKVLVTLGYATESEIANALAVQYQIPAVMLSSTVLDPAVVRLIPESIARRYLVIPLALDGDTLQVAMIDPLNVFAINEINRTTRYKIKTIVTTETEITNAINQYYHSGPIEPATNNASAAETEVPNEEQAASENLEKIAGDSSVVQLVDQLINSAVNDNASDVHIEPDGEILRVRMRIDGVLHDTLELPCSLHPAVIARIKLLGELDITQKNLPQDGRCFLDVSDRIIDIRLSTIPTLFGERAVMKIIDKSNATFELERMTPAQDTVELLKKAVSNPFGMILLTGPAGSGRTTTAYTLLNLLGSDKKNVVSVEDPVEYPIKRVNQVQVNPEAGITIASALRHILRQDPDIVMISEISGEEVAETAIQAALNGQVVIASIQTNSAISTISRLLHMGIEPYLISSSIKCIVGQRLVRKICDSCKQGHEADTGMLKEMGIKASALKNARFYRGAGCADCKGTGLKGRTGLFELLFLDDEIRSLINSKADSRTILDAAKKNGFQPLRTEGMRAVLAGHTTIDELLRVTQTVEY